jgi:tetratricopeptide (TPR) repeat protein
VFSPVILLKFEVGFLQSIWRPEVKITIDTLIRSGRIDELSKVTVLDFPPDLSLDGDEGKNGSAIAMLDALLEEHSELLRSPDCGDLYESIQLRRLEYLVNVGRMIEALPLFVEATGFPLEKPDSFVFRMAYCLAKCGEFETAHNMMKKALAISRSRAQEARARYSIYVAAKDYDNALVELQFCQAHMGESDLSIPHMMDALAYVHEQMGHADEAALYRQAAGLPYEN